MAQDVEDCLAMNTLEWIEEHKPNMWFSEFDQVWIVYTDEVKRFEAPTLSEAIDKARADKESL